jgi:spore germination protein KB
LLIAQDVRMHFEQGRFALKYIFPLFAVVIPFLLMSVEMVRKNINAEKN